MEELVQPIVVLKENTTHHATIRAAALASVALSWETLSPDEENAIETWLHSRWIKTVRRASQKQWDRVIAWAGENNISYSTVTTPGGAALAFAPRSYSDFPKVLKTLQVAATDFPREEILPQPITGAKLALLDSLTTGKAAAQAAHGLWRWTLDLDTLDQWRDSGMPLQLTLLSSGQLDKLASSTGVALIHDAGLTEIEAGTLTVVVL
jgi:peptidyl-tRNA hydrolase